MICGNQSPCPYKPTIIRKYSSPSCQTTPLSRACRRLVPCISAVRPCSWCTRSVSQARPSAGRPAPPPGRSTATHRPPAPSPTQPATPPQNHPRDPRQREVARDLEETVSEEEHPGAESVRGAAEAQVAIHLERGEADVHPIEEVRDVEHEHERDEATGHAAERRGLERREKITH